MVTRTVLKSPNVLCIYNGLERGSTLSFLRDIDVRLLKNYEFLVIDLSKVTSATAAASLLLFAIVNRAQLLRDNANIVSFRLPNREKNPDGYRWIVKTGLARALKSGSEDKLEELKIDEQFFQSSSEPMIHLFSTIDMLQVRAQLDEEQLHLLSSGISEAMLNVSHHAYDSPAFDFDNAILGKRWWQCAWFDPSKDKTVFIICDLGVGIFSSFSGIPASLAPTAQKEAEIVKLAFTLGQTRFKLSERGKGSEDIKAPIRSECAKEEFLLVYTGRTMYNYTSAKDGPTAKPITEFMPGTLVQWELCPLRRKNDG